MEFLIEVIKFVIYCFAIVVISIYILVWLIRKIDKTLKLQSKTVGNIAGYATSVPELLTVVASSLNGLIGASLYNILSSNVINFSQYIASILINKNLRLLKNKIIKIDIILVLITIVLPIIFITANLEINIITVLIFILLYITFKYIDVKTHKIYYKLNNLDENTPKLSRQWKESAKYIICLLLTSILLFAVGNLLGDTLVTLCNRFNVPQTIIGILLGLITSVPELITFFEAQKHHKKSQNDLEGVIEATNNLFTSNTLNLFIIQSIGVLIYIFWA